MILHPRIVRRRAEYLERKFTHVVDYDKPLAEEIWKAAQLLKDIARCMDKHLYTADGDTAEAQRILAWLGDERPAWIDDDPASMGETRLTDEQDDEITRHWARGN